MNHLQFNPVDPGLLLYCHEGTWHELDRTWTIRTDGSAMRLMHKRTMDMEINGHEWWSWDGRTVWFDLQTPRSQVFWLAGVNVETGKQSRYHVERDWWGIHFNSSRDDTPVCQRRRRSVPGGVFERRDVDQPVPGPAGRNADAREARRHVTSQLRDRPRRRRTERAHHARQEMGRVHRRRFATERHVYAVEIARQNGNDRSAMHRSR